MREKHQLFGLRAHPRRQLSSLDAVSVNEGHAQEHGYQRLPDCSSQLGVVREDLVQRVDVVRVSHLPPLITQCGRLQDLRVLLTGVVQKPVDLQQTPKFVFDYKDSFQVATRVDLARTTEVALGFDIGEVGGLGQQLLLALFRHH